jgi:hypothetical protein
MNKSQIIDKMAVAIRSADSSYFNENYTKQATAAWEALEKAGYTVIPKDYPKDIWEKAADKMMTGNIKPIDHVKDVYETVLKLAAKS